MKTRINVKSILLFVAFVLLAWFLYKSNRNSEIERLRKENEELIKKARIEKENEIEILQAQFDSTVKALNNEVTELSERAESLTNKIRNYEKKPPFDIDFVAAFRIIANSHYGPGQTNGDVGQSEDD